MESEDPPPETRLGDHQQAALDHERASLDHQQAAMDARNAEAARQENQKKEAAKKEEEQKKQAQKKKPIWPWLVGGSIVLVFVLIVLYIVLAPHANQETDDAYVTAHYSVVAPRVAGQIAQLLVDDNQTVQAGQTLLLLDDRDFKASLSQAEAALASDQARAAQAAAEVERQPDVILQAETQVTSARARLELSSSNAQRYEHLASTGAGTVQQRQQTNVGLRQDEASLASAIAERNAAKHQLDALRADLSAARARVVADLAALDQARLNLSYTRILSPIDGVVDQRSIQVGNFVAPGTPVMTVVPLKDIYVLANYREVAMRHMRPGQPVLIHVDTYDIDLRGIVESLPASSGASYSPIAPNNATGNFTKIVQRFPVKIVFAPEQRLVNLVRVGMSVETTVKTGLNDVTGAQSREDSPVTAKP